MSLRLTGGDYRNRPLTAPEGRATRPTGARVREALFSMLESRFPGRLAKGQVVDAFAGSGALGLEALSRGAAHVTFLETDATCVQAIQHNLAALGLTDRATVHQTDAARPPRPAAPCTLAFLDPPYASPELGPDALQALARAGWLATEAVAVLEHRAKTPPAIPAAFTVAHQRSYRDTSVAFLVAAEDADAAGQES